MLFQFCSNHSNLQIKKWPLGNNRSEIFILAFVINSCIDDYFLNLFFIILYK